MKYRLRVLLYVEACFRLIPRVYAFICTWVKFFFFCTSFGHFQTSGIPYISVSRKSDGEITIGEGFSMNNGMANNQIGFGKTPCVLSASGGRITIGENVGISQTALIAFNADITIGDNTILGGGSKVYTSDFHPVEDRGNSENQSQGFGVKSASVNIGRDCFIGAGVMILKGVRIGDGTVIGAGSIVTKSIPEYCVAAGNPCHVIRYIENV